MKNPLDYKVAVIIPTYNGLPDIAYLLDSLSHQRHARFDIIIIDSTSLDNTVNYARTRVNYLVVINKDDFGHGKTRQYAIDSFPDYDIYVFMTQDACLANQNSIANIIAPFIDSDIGAVCGRQLPSSNATLIAKHARLYNYPSISSVKRKSDISRIGLKAAFMSNSFSAYRRAALLDVGGFPSDVIFAEDMVVAAKMILNNWTIMYNADAMCIHSHNYSPVDEFRRYFDIGVLHAREGWIMHNFGGPRGEGFAFVRSELCYIGLSRFYMWPRALVQNVSKLIGYKLGLNYIRLPRSVIKSFSSFPSFQGFAK